MIRDLDYVLDYMTKYVKDKYKHDSEPMLNYKDIEIVLKHIYELEEENERLINILNEIKNMCKEEYYERNTTDIDSIGLSNNIWVMIYMKIKELKGEDNE